MEEEKKETKESERANEEAKEEEPTNQEAPKKKGMRKFASQKELRRDKEGKWVHNFQFMCSKDNNHFHASLREFFDNPRSYNVEGSRRYNENPKAYTKGNYSMRKNILSQSGAKAMRNTEGGPGKSGKVVNIRKPLSKPLHEFDAPDMYNPIPFLRKRSTSPIQVKREVSWDNRMDGISTFNSTVHPHFRINFADLTPIIAKGTYY